MGWPGRKPSWASSLAAVTAVLVAVDVFHVLGLGLANAGDLGYRLTKSITQSPYQPVAWAVGILAIIWLRRGRKEGLSLAAVAGLQIAFLGGVADLSNLSRSEVPFGFAADLARLAVALSVGLGLGLALVAVLRAAGMFGPARTPAPDDALAPADQLPMGRCERGDGHPGPGGLGGEGEHALECLDDRIERESPFAFHAHVVRERFKIRRQVRVHTAHGRFTGYVLLALPAALGIILSYLSPDHMNTLFTEPQGKTMLLGAGVMQCVGYIWIRKVIKIEV